MELQLSAILRAAGVDMDFDYDGEHTHLIAKIVDLGNPDHPAIEDFANDWEYHLFPKHVSLP